MRRTPRQARSRRTLTVALEAADRLLAAEGVVALTTTRIAAEAGISVGALYQYLPDRDAVLDLLAERYLRQGEALMGSFVESAAQQVLPDLVTTLVDAFAELYRSQPALRALWLGRHLTERVREAERLHQRTMAAGLHRILVAQGLLGEDACAETACYTAFLAADAVLQDAFRADPEGAPAMLDQLKTMLRAYLAELAIPGKGGRRARR